MSAADSRQRLEQAQRIAAIKTRRKERERIAAVKAEREALAAAALAASRSAAAEQAHCDARAMFFAAPQVAAAEVWLIATNDRAQHAEGERQSATAAAGSAAIVAAAARREHERVNERARYLDDRAAILSRDAARRAQDRTDDETGERRQ